MYHQIKQQVWYYSMLLNEASIKISKDKLEYYETQDKGTTDWYNNYFFV